MRGIGSRTIVGGSYAFRRGVNLAAARRRHLRVAEYGILRGLTPRAEIGKAGRAQSVEDNKENLPPWGSGPWRPGRRWVKGKKRSPLPSWYPRMPLRDITAIVNVIERRRTSLHAFSPPQDNTLSNEMGSLDQEPSQTEDTPSHQIFTRNLASQPAKDSNLKPGDSQQIATQVGTTSGSQVEIEEPKVLQGLHLPTEGNLGKVSKGNACRQTKNILMTMR